MYERIILLSNGGKGFLTGGRLDDCVQRLSSCVVCDVGAAYDGNATGSTKK